MKIIYIEEFAECLKSKGLRLTKQRKLVLELMQELNESLLSIEEIFERLKDRDSSISLSTVYRTLILLEEIELVHRVYTKDGYASYQFGRHSSCQFICSSCGGILDADEAFFKSFDDLIQKKEFVVKNYKLNIYGCCSNCLS